MRDDTIAVIAFDRISPFHLSVPCAVFGEDRREAGVPKFELLICGMEEGPLATSAGFSLTGLSSLKDLEGAGMIIVPSWRDPSEPPPQLLLTALVKARERGATLVGLCLGSYVLAAAGLLDGCRATTHWAWAEDFALRYPQIELDRDVLYVDEGKVVTSAGGAAGIDCCLHMLRRLHGAEISSRVARRLVVPPHRQGGQAQYIERPLRENSDTDPFSKTLDWVQQHLDQPHDLDSLADRSFMSRRTFTRRFRQTTGTTVGSWLLNKRLSMAQRLLETTAMPVEMVAQQSGFGSQASLRQHFHNAFSTSPARYRKEFRST